MTGDWYKKSNKAKKKLKRELDKIQEDLKLKKKVDKENERIAKDLGITLTQFNSIVSESITDPIINNKNKDKFEAIFCKAYNCTPKEYEDNILTLPITEYKSKLKAILTVHKELKDIIPEMRKDKKEIGKPKKQNKTTDEQKIKDYIDLALKLGDIPKGKKNKSKTMYRKLKDENFLIKLIAAIKKRLDSNYNYSEGKLIVLENMYSHFSAILMQVTKDTTKKKQSNETEYNDDLNYTNY